MAKIRFKRDKENRPLTKEEKTNLIIRAVLFFLLLGGGLTAIGFGVKSCTTTKPGYYVIEGDTDPDIKGYDDGSIKLTFYVDGDSATSDYKEVTKIYSESMKLSFATVNKYNHINAYSTLYDINNAPYGTEVEVNNFLYNTLKECYSYSESYSNYSLFNGPIYDFWEYLFTMDSSLHEQNDPLSNKEHEEYLSSLMDVINNKDNYSLSFNDEKKAVTLNISEEYQSFIDNRYKYRETKLPILSFNVLEDAIRINHLAASLKEKGYTRGYISSDNGLLMHLGGLENIQYNLLDYISEGIYTQAGIIKIDGRSVANSFRRFEINNRLYSPYYSFKKGEETIYRSNYIDNSTGYPTDYFSATNLYSTSLSPIETSLLNNELIKSSSLEETKEMIKLEMFNNVNIAFTCFKSEKTIYLTNNLKDYLTIKEELDYNLIEL